MSSIKKNQQNILAKLKIEKINPMQEETQSAVASSSEVVLLSPTGTGKTLAFLLPIVASLDENESEIQAMIIVPSRELAIQIEQVFREMGSGFKSNAVYGGSLFSKDKANLKHRPAILVGTPGRIFDHLRRTTFSTEKITTLVLDEFDKSLEVGFESEMTQILSLLPNLSTKILTSATQAVQIPSFVGLKKPTYIDYLGTKKSKLEMKMVMSPEKNKLNTLFDTLCFLGNHPGIIFCNFKDTVQFVSKFLTEKNIPHGCFYGGMEQKERERSLIKFRNGTHKLIIATDLAARGIDVPEIKFIIHYHLPIKESEFTHRNGRTARMNSEGTAYVLQYEKDYKPDFVKNIPVQELTKAVLPVETDWTTLFISGGRQDKISKGDIAGLFFKQGNLTKEELGTIELKIDCAFVAVASSKANGIIKLLNNTKLKNKKVRITLV